MTDFPLSLYRDGWQFDWDGRTVDARVVDDAEGRSEAEQAGWRTAEDFWATPTAPTLLDKNATDITAELPGLALEDLESLLKDETAGKSRKGVVAALNEAIDAKLKG